MTSPTPSLKPVDWSAVQHDLQGLNLLTSLSQRKQASKDFYWYSPILTEQLKDCLAELVVKVTNEDDVRQVARVAAKYQLPLTVRAGGTGNYGQCVPLEGGIVVDVTQMCRILDLQDGSVRAEAGACMHDIEQAVAETGQALRMWPSTWHVASIGGFIAGGFGGIGSIRHGILRDSGNLIRARVMTVESNPQIIELVGDE
ncbi:MAG: FAD-binding oxidoreductase, partial [Comamonas sp.]